MYLISCRFIVTSCRREISWRSWPITVPQYLCRGAICDQGAGRNPAYSFWCGRYIGAVNLYNAKRRKWLPRQRWLCNYRWYTWATTQRESYRHEWISTSWFQFGTCVVLTSTVCLQTVCTKSDSMKRGWKYQRSNRVWTARVPKAPFCVTSEYVPGFQILHHQAASFCTDTKRAVLN